MKRHLKSHLQKRNRAKGRLVSTIKIIKQFHSGYFKSAREVQNFTGWKAGRCRVSAMSLWLQYRSPKYYSGIFSTELRQIKSRFIKEKT